MGIGTSRVLPAIYNNEDYCIPLPDKKIPKLISV